MESQQPKGVECPKNLTFHHHGFERRLRAKKHHHRGCRGKKDEEGKHFVETESSSVTGHYPQGEKDRNRKGKRKAPEEKKRNGIPQSNIPSR